jgi:hypothetical protein
MTRANGDSMRELSRRTFLARAAGGALALSAGPYLLRTPLASAVEPVARRLAFGADPATAMSVTWSTLDATDAAVRVLHAGEEVATVHAATVEVGGLRHHRAPVAGLSPGTTYDYELVHGGQSSSGASFTTAPDGAAPFTFTAFGDQGTGAGAAAINAAVAAQSPAFNLHVGDLCYAYNLGTGTGGSVDPTKWDAWLRLIDPVASRVPWMVSVGNHEMEPGFGDLGYDGVLARLALPATGAAGSPVVYACRYGNVAVVSLDANDISHEISHNNDYSGGAQTRWLDVTLAALRADPGVDWIVVGFHHCARCTNVLHGSDGAVRELWEPLFDAHGVDVVVNGHNHSYERTHPLRAGEVTQEVAAGERMAAGNGTVYLTAGCGGNPRVEVATAPVSYVTLEGGLRMPELTPWSATRYTDLSFVAFDVVPHDRTGATTLTIRALTDTGALVDTVTLARPADRRRQPPDRVGTTTP